MRQFEYSIGDISICEDIKKWLNIMGKKGWELVAINKEYYIFKREL